MMQNRVLFEIEVTDVIFFDRSQRMHGVQQSANRFKLDAFDKIGGRVVLHAEPCTQLTKGTRTLFWCFFSTKWGIKLTQLGQAFLTSCSIMKAES